MGDVFSFPRTSREIAKVASLRVVDAIPAEDRPRVDVSNHLENYRVWLLGRPYRDFVTLANASRCAAALMVLDALDALPGQHPTPTEAVRAMLAAPIADLDDGSEPPAVA